MTLRSRINIYLTLSLLLLAPAGAAAESGGDFIPFEMKIVEAEGKVIACARKKAGSKFLSGVIKRKAGSEVYISNQSKVAGLKKKMKLRKLSSSSAIGKKIARLQAQMKAFNKLCAGGGLATPTPAPNSSPGNPTPTPIPNKQQPPPVPTKTPTPSSNSSQCDSAGNTRQFGIPSGFLGNKFAGDSLWNNTCRGCHMKPWYGRSYSQIKGSTESIGAMLFLRLSTQELSDMTAFLNCR